MTTATQSTAVIDLSKGPSGWLQNDLVRHRIGAALAGWMDPEAFLGQVQIALQDPKLNGCSPESLFYAAHTCAALQLLPTLNQVALIPRNMKIVDPKTNEEKTVKMCKVMPQWQGYKAIMERHPDVLEVTPELVHINDKYSYSNGMFTHEYDPFDATRKFTFSKSITEVIKGGYGQIQYRTGRTDKHFFCPADYIDRSRACAETQNIWQKWPESMMLKTVMRFGYARRAVPVDPLVVSKMQKILEEDDQVLGNEPLRQEVTGPPIGRVTFDQLSNCGKQDLIGVKTPEWKSEGIAAYFLKHGEKAILEATQKCELPSPEKCTGEQLKVLGKHLSGLAHGAPIKTDLFESGIKH